MHDKTDFNNIQEVVVVEGYHDLALLKSIYPSMDVVITNGSEISDTTLQELKKLQETRGLILFLDPDYQGERIRRIITDFVGPTKHAFLPQEYAISKNGKKVGIEHALTLHIIDSLRSVKTTSSTHHSSLTTTDMYRLGLIGTSDAKEKRMRLSKSLGIGYANGKTFLQKLQMFGITKEQVMDHLKE